MGNTLCGSRGTRNGLINCQIGHIRGTGVVFHGSGLVDDCKVYDTNNFAPYPRGSGELDWGAGIISVGQGASIRSCNVYENWGEGIIAGRRSDSTVIADNDVYDNFAGQIYVDNASNVSISDNNVWFANPEFYRGERPSFGIALANEVGGPTENVEITGNTVEGCSHNIGLWNSVNNVLVEENTLIEGHDNAFVSWASNYENVEIKNNTIFQEDETKIWDGNFTNIVREGNIINPSEPEEPKMYEIVYKEVYDSDGVFVERIWLNAFDSPDIPDPPPDPLPSGVVEMPFLPAWELQSSKEDPSIGDGTLLGIAYIGPDALDLIIRLEFGKVTSPGVPSGTGTSRWYFTLPEEIPQPEHDVVGSCRAWNGGKEYLGAAYFSRAYPGRIQINLEGEVVGPSRPGIWSNKEYLTIQMRYYY
jgi:hypothetical protein